MKILFLLIGLLVSLSVSAGTMDSKISELEAAMNNLNDEGYLVSVEKPGDRLWDYQSRDDIAVKLLETFTSCLKQVKEENPNSVSFIERISFNERSSYPISGRGVWFNSDFYSGIEVNSKLTLDTCKKSLVDGVMYRGRVMKYFITLD